MMHKLERVAPLQGEEGQGRPQLYEQVTDDVQVVQQLILVALASQLSGCFRHLLFDLRERSNLNRGEICVVNFRPL